MTIDPEGEVAPYLQLAEILRKRIESEQIPPGRRIPSQTELEQEFSVSRGTIKRAVEVLRREGLVRPSPAR